MQTLANAFPVRVDLYCAYVTVPEPASCLRTIITTTRSSVDELHLLDTIIAAITLGNLI